MSISKNWVDLHTHSIYSDGNLPPVDIVQAAAQAGLRAIALTDHDTVDGIDEAIALGKTISLEVIPGIEVSTLSEHSDIHILGYFIDYTDIELQATLKKFKEKRLGRAHIIVDKLNYLDIPLSFEEVLNMAGHSATALGRLHIAKALVNGKYVNSIKEAFDKYLSYNCPAYVEKFQLSPFEAIDLIRRFGGIPVLAHPGVTRRDELISGMVRAGLLGIECHHPVHPKPQVEYYRRLCHKYNLLITGGSDWHGDYNNSSISIGDIRYCAPYKIVEQMRSHSKLLRINNY